MSELIVWAALVEFVTANALGLRYYVKALGNLSPPAEGGALWLLLSSGSIKAERFTELGWKFRNRFVACILGGFAIAVIMFVVASAVC